MATVGLKPERANGKTRIQALNQARIMAAAETVFAEHGFRGATVDEIARCAEMSKPNLLYYFNSKKALYRAVLEHTLDIWLEPLAEIDAEAGPGGRSGFLAQAARSALSAARVSDNLAKKIDESIAR